MVVTKKSGEFRADEAAGVARLNEDVADGLEESSSASTGSWDMTEFTEADVYQPDIVVATASVQTSDLGVHLQDAEAEQQIALLQNQVATLRAENLEQSKTVEKQKLIIQDLTQKVAKYDELVAENAMKKTLLENQDTRIKELVKELEKKTGVEGDQVTDKFYEAEDEIAGLRKENAKAVEIIEAILLVKDVFDKQSLDKDFNLAKIFNVLWKGLESTEIPRLKALANDLSTFALELEDKYAIAFISNAEGYVYQKTPHEDAVLNTLRRAFDIIYTRPSMLLEDNQLLHLSANFIERSLLKESEMNSDELTLFRILLKWTRSNDAERLDTGKRLVKHIALEHIHPVSLSTIVRSSGLVSDSQLCDAYGKQAANKSIIGKRRVRQPVEEKSVPSARVFKWDTSDSTVLSSSGCWKTGRIASRPLKGVDRFEWSIRVEKTGGILFGVTTSRFQQDVTKFGMFLPKFDLKKDSVLSFRLDRKVLSTTLRASVSGKVWKTFSFPSTDEQDDLLVTASVQDGASVQFLGFDN